MTGVKLRRVATVVAISDNSVVVELCKPLNGDSLDGLTEWSHCWLVGLDITSNEIVLRMFEIEKSERRKIFLNNISDKWNPDLWIIDMKPIHPLDL